MDEQDYSMYLRLGKGLAIYRQKHSQSYYVRLRIDKKNVQRCLKVTNEDDAKRSAYRFEDEMKKREFAGLPIIETKRLTIKKAFEGALELLDSREKQLPIYESYKTLINLHMIPFFKNKSIEDLTSKNIRLYFDGRELSLTRKRMTNTCFKLMFQYLEEENYINKADIPTLPKTGSKTVEKRDAFTNVDLAVIREKLADFHNVGKPNFKTKEYRQTIYHYFNFLVETGIRAGEEATFLFSNVVKERIKGEEHHYIEIKKGKTKGYSNNRSIPLSKLAVSSLVEMAKIQNPDKEITKKNFIFIRRPILEASFGKSGEYVRVFKQFIDKLLKDNLISKPYTLYSCRHYFITKRLSEDVDVYLLSKYVGNSPEMIRQHYDHAAQLKKAENIDSVTGRDREQESKDEAQILAEKEQELSDAMFPDFDDVLAQMDAEIDHHKSNPNSLTSNSSAQNDNYDDYKPMTFQDDRETIELELRQSIEQELREKIEKEMSDKK